MRGCDGGSAVQRPHVFLRREGLAVNHQRTGVRRERLARARPQLREALAKTGDVVRRKYA